MIKQKTIYIKKYAANIKDQVLEIERFLIDSYQKDFRAIFSAIDEITTIVGMSKIDWIDARKETLFFNTNVKAKLDAIHGYILKNGDK